MTEFEIRRAPAGPYVSVLTVSGPVENGTAQDQLRAELAEGELVSRSVVVDLTEATLYDSWPIPLLAGETDRFGERGGRLVVVSGDNPTVTPFIGDGLLPRIDCFGSLDDAMLELLGDVSKLGNWPPSDD